MINEYSNITLSPLKQQVAGSSVYSTHHSTVEEFYPDDPASSSFKEDRNNNNSINNNNNLSQNSYHSFQSNQFSMNSSTNQSSYSPERYHHHSQPPNIMKTSYPMPTSADLIDSGSQYSRASGLSIPQSTSVATSSSIAAVYSNNLDFPPHYSQLNYPNHPQYSQYSANSEGQFRNLNPSEMDNFKSKTSVSGYSNSKFSNEKTNSRPIQFENTESLLKTKLSFDHKQTSERIALNKLEPKPTLPPTRAAKQGSNNLNTNPKDSRGGIPVAMVSLTEGLGNKSHKFAPSPSTTGNNSSKPYKFGMSQRTGLDEMLRIPKKN